VSLPQSSNSNPGFSRVVTTRSDGIPHTFTATSATGTNFLLSKGQLNKLRLRPQIINEHVESSRNLVDVVTSTNIVGQIFKASHDNINGIEFTARTEQDFVVDDFESYTDSADLQADWVASNPAELALLETTIVHEGTQAMNLPGEADVGDEWEVTLAPTDLTDATGSLWIQQTHAYSALKLRFYVGDGVNTKSAPIVVQNVDIWEEIEIPETLLTEDGGGTTDITNITKVGFRLEDARVNSQIYIDLMTAALAPGSVKLKLWDMGTEIPVSGVTSIDDGTQYTKLGDAGISGVQVADISLILTGGFRQYHVNEFVAGPALEIPTNELLTVGNYYMITFNYVDKDIEMYGSNPAWDNYYENGYSFSAPDESTAITATGANEDLQFIIYSTQDVYIRSFLQFQNAQPGNNSSALMDIEDKNMKITSVVIAGVKGEQIVQQDFGRPPLLDKGGKFELNYNDDATDSVTAINLIMTHYFAPESVNG
jgi:hypothetical protein